MVKNDIKSVFEQVYVLAEYRFMCYISMTEIQKFKKRYAKKLHVIGLMKTNSCLMINGINKMANLVADHMLKDFRFCKKYKCNYFAIRIEYNSNKIKAFWKMTKGSETWKMLTSDNTDITFTSVMKYYLILRSMEVFFKEYKKNLNINNCHSTNFEAHIAWITVSSISYMMISIRKRFDYYETMPKVFKVF
jgi:hypothetical protein